MVINGLLIKYKTGAITPSICRKAMMSVGIPKASILRQLLFSPRMFIIIESKNRKISEYDEKKISNPR
jgi:hypothetical protein